MVDKSIGELVAASQINDNDLFVLEQSGEAKKLLGNLLKQYITRNVMSVSVSALPPDSEPTVSYDPNTGTLELGIPRGEKGESGESSAGYVSGIVKGDGAGGVSAAVAGTDYAPGGYGYGQDIRFASWDDTDGSKLNAYLDGLDDGNYKTIRMNNISDYPALLVSGNGGYADVHFTGSGDILVKWHGYANVLLPGDNGTSYLAVKKRTREKGWSPWEYVNPPMEVGVEYRTTERYMGKPVYVKVVDFGVLPAINTYKSVQYSSTNVLCVSCSISVMTPYGYGGICGYDTTLSGLSFTADASKVYIKAYVNTDSDKTAYATVKYTKTTD